MLWTNMHMSKQLRASAASGRVWRGQYSKVPQTLPILQAEHRDSLLHEDLLNYSIFLSPNAHFIRYSLNGIPVS